MRTTASDNFSNNSAILYKARYLPQIIIASPHFVSRSYNFVKHSYVHAGSTARRNYPPAEFIKKHGDTLRIGQTRLFDLEFHAWLFKTATGMNHSSLEVTPIHRSRDDEFQRLMRVHHYLGALPKIGNTIRHAAAVDNQWLGLLSFSAPALRCSARDEWIGWSHRHLSDRLKLLANNSRFLILPEHHCPNLASRILSRCERRLQQDWL